MRLQQHSGDPFSLDQRRIDCTATQVIRFNWFDDSNRNGKAVAGEYDAATERFTNVIYMPCTAENNFTPELPERNPGSDLSVLPEQPDRRYGSKASCRNG